MLLWPPKGSLRKFTLKLKGDLHTTHPPTHNDTNFILFWQMNYHPKFAIIGLEGPKKLKKYGYFAKNPICHQ
jgi:hypothetical protein